MPRPTAASSPEQLHALGLSDQAINHRIARGHLIRHLRGVDAAFDNLPSYTMNAYVLQYRVDIVMDGLILELDGRKTHGSRHAFEHDREEVAEIMAVTGIPVLRITHRQFHRAPAKQAERILAITARHAA